VQVQVRNNRQPVFALDHDVQNDSAENIAKYKKIEAFAKQVPAQHKQLFNHSKF